MIVVDASVLAYVIAVEPPHGPAHARLAAEAELHAPHLVDLEVVSTFRGLARSGQLTARDAVACLADLGDLPLVRYAHQPLLTRAWDLHDNLTVYDAIYVALAEALGAVLLTGDQAIARAPGLRCAVEIVTP